MRGVAKPAVMSGGLDSTGEIGWQVDVDGEAGEVRLEHPASGSVYVLDADGGLRVPGDSAVDGDLDALRETLLSALASSDDPVAVTDGGQSTGNCTIDCDPSTGAVTIESGTDVTIESDTRISLDAPEVDVSSSTTSVNASGVLTLQGALVKLN